MTPDLIIILNLILLESLLSVDNAAVLAAMVQKLPQAQRPKALHYGIIGAYVLRGVCLLFATWLMKVIWLKIVGGAYLCWLTYQYFTSNKTTMPDEDPTDDNWFTRWAKKFSGGIETKIGMFWSTVAMVELMDLAFSIDNIFACVAFTNKFFLICIGVFVGILAMRFVATGFVSLLEKYPTMLKNTYIIIAVLGAKLMLSGICDYLPGNPVSGILNSHSADLAFSIMILLFFFTPIVQSRFKHAGAR